MKSFAVLFLVLLWQPLVYAQTPITYKCWCTLRGGVEKEYTVPGNIYGEVTLPLEVPDYGRVLCYVKNDEGHEKTGSFANETPPSLAVSLSSVQQLQATKEGGYSPILIMAAGFNPAYNKRITVLDTPAYSIAVELLKN